MSNVAFYQTKTKLKFDLISLIGSKNSIKFKDSIPWVHLAFGNVFYLAQKGIDRLKDFAVKIG